MYILCRGMGDWRKVCEFKIEMEIRCVFFGSITVLFARGDCLGRQLGQILALSVMHICFESHCMRLSAIEIYSVLSSLEECDYHIKKFTPN